MSAQELSINTKRFKAKSPKGVEIIYCSGAWGVATKQYELLADSMANAGYDGIIIDYPHHSNSPEDVERIQEMSLYDYVDSVVDYLVNLKKNGQDNVELVVHSMGGKIAYQVLAKLDLLKKEGEEVPNIEKLFLFAPSPNQISLAQTLQGFVKNIAGTILSIRAFMNQDLVVKNVGTSKKLLFTPEMDNAAAQEILDTSLVTESKKALQETLSGSSAVDPKVLEEHSSNIVIVGCLRDRLVTTDMLNYMAKQLNCRLELVDTSYGHMFFLDPNVISRLTEIMSEQ